MLHQHFTERAAALALGISRAALRKYRKARIINPTVTPTATQNVVLYSLKSVENFRARYVVRRGKALAEK